jgi:hypothetical protein
MLMKYEGVIDTVDLRTKEWIAVDYYTLFAEAGETITTYW